jgi:H+/gluconate symporter-like permease
MLANPDRIEAQLFGVVHFCEEVFVVLLFGTILGVVIEES